MCVFSLEQAEEKVDEGERTVGAVEDVTLCLSFSLGFYVSFWTCRSPFLRLRHAWTPSVFPCLMNAGVSSSCGSYTPSTVFGLLTLPSPPPAELHRLEHLEEDDLEAIRRKRREACVFCCAAAVVVFWLPAP